MSTKVSEMSGRELAQYMGSDASDSDGDHMKELLCQAGYGEKSVSEISDAEWEAALVHCTLLFKTEKAEEVTE